MPWDFAFWWMWDQSVDMEFLSFYRYSDHIWCICLCCADYCKKRLPVHKLTLPQCYQLRNDKPAGTSNDMAVTCCEVLSGLAPGSHHNPAQCYCSQQSFMLTVPLSFEKLCLQHDTALPLATGEAGRRAKTAYRELAVKYGDGNS
jgi:hypothetical protein